MGRIGVMTCKASGCQKHANRIGAGLCEAHYMRQRRYGDCDHHQELEPVRYHTQGYRMVLAAGHPVARGKARAYEHRVVFYDAHGAGPFSCHWCGKRVGWSDMHVDHLNDDVQDNRVANLVAACPGCNLHRNEENMRASMRRRFGVTIDGVTMTYSEWAARAGISLNSLKARIAAGWDMKRAVTEPRGVTGPRRAATAR